VTTDRGTEPPAGDGDSETLKLILDELTARFTRQVDASKGIDTKDVDGHFVSAPGG
jgi:hypothetical protein